jgi:hypothetical protein
MRLAMLSLSFVLCLSLMIPQAGGTVTDFSKILPKSILGWEAVQKDAVYDRRTLYDYLDGGAEVYLAFDFKQVFVRKYSGPGQNEIALDIYDMGSSAEAFGVFSCDRQDEEAGIAQESEYGPGLLRFWQGPYFVSVTVGGDEREAEKAILALGRAAASSLGPPGAKPALLQCLPPEGLQPNRSCYFHSAINLNNRFFISSENILNLSRQTDCVLAEYGQGQEGPLRLLVVRYPEEGQAQAAVDSFFKSYLPQGRESGAAQTENRKWTMAKVHENYAAIAFDAPSREGAEQFLSSLRFQEK